MKIAILLALCGFLCAGLLRTQLIEPAAIAAQCDAAPWTGPVCTTRSITIMAFTEQRIGILALLAGLVSLLAGWRVVALLTLPVAAAGLVLYAAGWSAPALLLAALAVVPPSADAGRR